MKIKYISITLGQQGGIGYPPMIVKIKTRWYAVEDSRFKSIPDELYDFLERDRYHYQGWAKRKFRNATAITTQKLIEYIEDLNKDKCLTGIANGYEEHLKHGIFPKNLEKEEE